MTEPMALEAKALEAARAAFRINPMADHALANAIRAYLAALPSPVAGEGLEPVAWEWAWADDPFYWNLQRSEPATMNARIIKRALVFAATPSARAAVLEEALEVVRLEKRHLEADLKRCLPDGSATHAARTAVTVATSIEHAISALKEKT